MHTALPAAIALSPALPQFIVPFIYYGCAMLHWGSIANNHCCCAYATILNNSHGDGPMCMQMDHEELCAGQVIDQLAVEPEEHGLVSCLKRVASLAGKVVLFAGVLVLEHKLRKYNKRQFARTDKSKRRPVNVGMDVDVGLQGVQVVGWHVASHVIEWLGPVDGSGYVTADNVVRIGPIQIRHRI